MTPALRGPRHRAAVRRLNLRALIASASAIAGATVVAVALSGGSYAMWVDNFGVPAGTVQSGSIGLSTASSFTAANWSNLIAGESVRQPFTVTNTGTVPVALSATATATTSFAIRVVRSACPTSALTGTPASSSATALGTLAAGATATVCLEVSLLPAATANTSSAFTVTVAGSQN